VVQAGLKANVLKLPSNIKLASPRFSLQTTVKIIVIDHFDYPVTNRNMACENIGEPDPDIAGIGVRHPYNSMQVELTLLDSPVLLSSRIPYSCFGCLRLEVSSSRVAGYQT
jgi:hypothetical protein